MVLYSTASHLSVQKKPSTLTRPSPRSCLLSFLVLSSTFSHIISSWSVCYSHLDINFLKFPLPSFLFKLYFYFLVFVIYLFLIIPIHYYISRYSFHSLVLITFFILSPSDFILTQNLLPLPLNLNVIHVSRYLRCLTHFLLLPSWPYTLGVNRCVLIETQHHILLAPSGFQLTTKTSHFLWL